MPPLEDYQERMAHLWETLHLTNNGEYHKALKEELKNYLKAPNLMLFNNGTLALFLGLKALHLSGEVITTPFTFPATVEALDWLGLTPVFCDIRRDDYTIDADKIEALITEKTTAILAVHVFGNPCDTRKIQEIADRHHLKVIYDGAHAFSSSYLGQPIVSYGDMTMLSFHATKLFHTVEGGALVFSESKLEEELGLLRNFGIAAPEQVVLSGLNAKMSEVHAAMGLEVLPYVEQEKLRRAKILKRYKQGLEGVAGIRIVNGDESMNNSFQYLPIEVDQEVYGLNRDELIDLLKTHEIYGRKYFYPLCSSFSWYEGNPSTNPKNLSVAMDIAEKVMTLPYYGRLREEDVDYICACIRNKVIYQEGGE